MRIVFGIVASLIAAAPCWGGSIGIYTSNGTGCQLTMHLGDQAELMVAATTSTADPAAGFFDAGEFRIDGVPEAWLRGWYQDGGYLVEDGNPYLEGLHFEERTAQRGFAPLLYIFLWALTEEGAVEVRIVKSENPRERFGLGTDCPWLHFTCGGPCDAAGTCVATVSFFINQACTTGIQSTTWTGLRSLYR